MNEKSEVENERNMLKMQVGQYYKNQIPNSYSFNSQRHFGGGDNYTMWDYCTDTDPTDLWREEPLND